jgi:hypothetical protein
VKALWLPREGAIYRRLFKTLIVEKDSNMLSNKFRILAALVLVFILTIFWLTALKWPGSFHTYALMTFSFWVLLAVGIRHLSVNVGFALLAILLWVGYWLKLSIHLLNEIPWVEPIGRFEFSVREWNSVAIVSAVGALAFAFVGSLGRLPLDRGQVEKMKIKIMWTPGIRGFAYLFVVSATIAVVLLNEIYGLSHNGLRSAADLVWPLQGLFSWMFVIGIALPILVVCYLDANSGYSMMLATLVFTGAVALLGMSQYSRGIAALQILPLLVSLLLWRRYIVGLNNRRMIAIIVVMFLGIAVSIVGGQGRRVQTQPVYTSIQVDAPAQADTIIKETIHGLPKLLSRLLIDRWVGLEGVMAVVSYPDKGMGFFKKSLMERRTKDNVDTYTGVVSQSGFYDTSKYHFATIPGAFAFLYYSSSLTIVFLGSMLLGAIVIATEWLIRQTTGNIFLSTQVGFFSAMLVLQLGAGGVVQPGSILIFTLVCATVVGFVGRYYLGRIIKV